MARGNERRDSFRDDRNRKRFLETLGEMAQRFGVRGVGVLPDATNHYGPVQPRDRHPPWRWDERRSGE